MNHYQMMIDMLNKANHRYDTENKVINQYWVRIEPKMRYYIGIQNGITSCGVGLGYSGFESIWLFDSNGSFLTTGAYE